MQYIILFRPEDREDHFERYKQYDGFRFFAKNDMDALIQIGKREKQIREQFPGDISHDETSLLGNIYEPVMKYTRTGARTMFFKNIDTGRLINHSKFPYKVF